MQSEPKGTTLADTKPIDWRQTARMIARAFDRDERIMKLGPDSDPLVIVRRNTGEIISDPDCEHDFQALESGLFIRFPYTAGELKGFKWLRWCSSDDLPAMLEAHTRHWSWIEREGISVSIAARHVLAGERRDRTPPHTRPGEDQCP
jgi:hypothetical protein